MSVLYALDLDQELLGHLGDSQSWDVIKGEGITTDLINDEFVIAVFEWQKQYLRDHKKLATIPILEDEFEGLFIEEPQTAIGDLLDRLRERYSKNQQRDKIETILKQQKEDPTVVPDLLVKIGRELKTVLQKKGEVYGSGDIDRVIHQYYQKTLMGEGASYGFKELDQYFVGARGLSALMGAPKSMKSWIGMQMLLSNVMAGKCVWHFSLELPAVESDWRLKCLLANIPYWKYIHNKLTEEDLNNIRDASALLDESGLYRIAKPKVGERTIDDMVYMAGDAGAEVIIIDQLQYIETGDGINLGSHNNTGMYWNVLNKARDYSDEIPIIYMHQFHRMNATEMPSMEHAKGSSAIEETATVAFGLWADKDMKRNNKREIGILAARNHEFASWEIAYDMKYGCNFEITGRTDLDDDDVS